MVSSTRFDYISIGIVQIFCRMDLWLPLPITYPKLIKGLPHLQHLPLRCLKKKPGKTENTC